MRLPNHVVLDFEVNFSEHDNNNSWYKIFVDQKKSYGLVLSSFNLEAKFIPTKRPSARILRDRKRYMIKITTLSTQTAVRRLSFKLKPVSKTRLTNSLVPLVNINFLRKERLYTKLKYSRSPAYDIVSGGAAALLAGFIGFLISEKYGFELVDSGDFYYLFMYLVFIGFSIRPLLTSVDYNSSFTSVFSLKFFLDFYVNLLYYIFKKKY